MLCGGSPSVYAQSINTTNSSNTTGYAPIVISEVLPGNTDSASQEFIELYNQSTQSIDLHKDTWQLQIATSTATDWTRAKTVNLTGIFYPGTYMLLSSSYIAAGQTEPYLNNYASAHFSSGMTGASGHVRLINKVSLATTQPAISAVEWSTRKDSGEATSPAIAPFSSLSLADALQAGASIKRRLHATSHQFVQTLALTAQDTSAGQNQTSDLLQSTCPSPTANNTSAYQVTAEQGPIATDIDNDNQSCIEQDEQETTPDVLLPDNQQGQPEVQNEGLASPQITELLPNPASPATDGEDEFIELYNPNQGSFDLSGYTLEVMSTSIKQYVIPEGTAIAALGYITFMSSQTHLSLPNTSAQVVLRSPGKQGLSQSDIYSTAKEGQSWAYIDGVWQWTLRQTPGTANIRSQPIAATAAKVSTAVATSKAKVAAKTAATKAKATTKSAKSKSTKATKADVSKAQTVAKVTTMSPLHPVVLAVVGGFAILYGAYEYRGDVANKIHQFRTNRANRRANR